MLIKPPEKPTWRQIDLKWKGKKTKPKMNGDCYKVKATYNGSS
jgi:hypothetical protein